MDRKPTSSKSPRPTLAGWLAGCCGRWRLNARSITVMVPYVWLLALFLAPFLIVFKISFSKMKLAIPPYEPLLEMVDGVFVQVSLSWANYQFLFDDALYVNAYISSLKIALVSTAITLLVGYPIAYAMARAPQTWRMPLVMMVILPFWTSFLIRVYAWIGILKPEGFLNMFLLWLGVIDKPLVILYTDVAVYIGIVYSYLPFMILPLYASLEKMDHALLEAAADLGCPPLKTFWKVTFPLSRTGVIAGCFLVFIPAVGEFVIPDLLGGSSTLMIGKVLWTEFFNNRDWPLASAAAVVLLVVLVVPIVWFQKFQSRHQALGGEARR